MKTGQHNRRVTWALFVVAVAASLTGCSSSGTNEPPTPVVSSSSGDAAAACSDATELKSSLQSLAEIEPLHDGLDALKDASATTRADLEAAVTSATDELRPAVEEVTTSFTAVQTAMSGLTTDNLTEKAPDIATALRGLGTALDSLGATLSQECPES